MTTAPPRRRTGRALAAASVLLALCLGLSAPSVSPVAPPGPAAVVVDGTGGRGGG